jgi:peptidoglycan-associated lipoprotein
MKMKNTLCLKLCLLLILSVLCFTVSCAKKPVQTTTDIAVTEAAEAERRAQEAARFREQSLRDEETDATRQAQRLEQEQIEAKKRFEAQDIYFSFDRSDLSVAAQTILRKKSTWLLENPSVTVVIEGHCDERGTTEYNLALGERRAESAKRFLTDLGIHPDRLMTISYGEEKPLDPRHDKEAWAKNRRAHFVLK